MRFSNALVTTWTCLAACSLVACGPLFRDVRLQKVETIRVTSEPSGAAIFVRDENGSRSIGQTPTSFSTPYVVVERRANAAACAAVGADAVSSHLPDPNLAASGEGRAALAILGLFGTVVGAAAGAQSCKDAEGIVAVESSPVAVSARLDGYLPVEVELKVPKNEPAVHFELAEDPDRPLVAREPGRGAPALLVVFELLAPGGEFDAGLLRELSEQLTQQLGQSQRIGRVILEKSGDWMQQAGEGQRRDCAQGDCRMEVCQRLGASHALVSLLLKNEQQCTFQATLVEVRSRQAQHALSLRSGCSPEQLRSSLQRVVELFDRPAENELVSAR